MGVHFEVNSAIFSDFPVFVENLGVFWVFSGVLNTPKHPLGDDFVAERHLS